jgi:hypothetical protein
LQLSNHRAENSDQENIRPWTQQLWLLSEHGLRDQEPGSKSQWNMPSSRRGKDTEARLTMPATIMISTEICSLWKFAHVYSWSETIHHLGPEVNETSSTAYFHG